MYIKRLPCGLALQKWDVLSAQDCMEVTKLSGQVTGVAGMVGPGDWHLIGAPSPPEVGRGGLV